MKFSKIVILSVIFISACSFFSKNISGIWHTSDDQFVVNIELNDGTITGSYAKTELSREGFPLRSFGGNFEGVKASGGYRFSWKSEEGDFGTGSIGIKDEDLVWKMERSIDSEKESVIMKEALLSPKD